MTRTYCGKVAYFPRNSRVSRSACKSWKGLSKLYKAEQSISLFSTKSAVIGALFLSKIYSLLLKFTSLNNSLSVLYFDFFSLFTSLLSSISSTKTTLEGSVLSEVNKSPAFLSNFLSSVICILAFYIF